MSLDNVTLGFVPLVDSAILVAAREKGFAEAEGLQLTLRREASWAAIRDKVAVGVLDGAHMLAGIPLAAQLGFGGGQGMIAPMALGLGGNAVTVSNALYERMVKADPEAMAGAPGLSARALQAVIEADRRAGRPPLSFASVFPFSSHNYELRYWMGAVGIDPDRDVNLGIFAPPRMVDSLRSGWIDGYCVGEPWCLRAVTQGVGRVVVSKADIWPYSPEKVLGLNAAWARDNPDLMARLVRALVAAAIWADTHEHRAELADLLALPDYVGGSPAVLREALIGRGGAGLPDRHVFFRFAATYPWRAQALWLLTQMRRWEQIAAPPDMAAVVDAVYRPDLYQAALAGSGVPVPQEKAQILGTHDAPYEAATIDGDTMTLAADRFLDGRTFDPSDPDAYLRRLATVAEV